VSFDLLPSPLETGILPFLMPPKFIEDSLEFKDIEAGVSSCY
jgi:hypothetical protein